MANSAPHTPPLKQSLEKNMPSCFDIYVLSEKRSQKDIEIFLDTFLPNRVEMADEYEYPQYSDTPDQLYGSSDEIIRLCCGDKVLEYGLYWSGKGDSPAFGMIFFIEDGHVIYGLSNDDAFPLVAQELLEKMKKHLNCTAGYIAHEASPEASCKQEFIKQIELHRDIL